MATTPNRKDAYMGAMKKAEKKPLSSAPAKGPGNTFVGSKPSTTSKLAPATSKRPQPIGPARAVRENQAKFDRAAGLGDDGPKAKPSALAPVKSKRPVASPAKKQKTYPGRTPYNYAV